MIKPTTGERLLSKKNFVYRERGEQQDVVVKIFSDLKRFQREREIGDLLQGSSLATPARYSCDENSLTIIYQFVEGSPVVDFIENTELSEAEDIIGKICVWLLEFYSIIRGKQGCQYILGDIHLRNFIYNRVSQQVYGFDFEECRIGQIESDVARLFVFILHYDPAFTPRKKALANYLWENLSAPLALDETLFQQEVKRETLELINRRAKRDITRSRISK